MLSLAADNVKLLDCSRVLSCSVTENILCATVRPKRHSKVLSLLKKPAALEPVDPGSSASWPSATAMASWCYTRAFRARARIVQRVGVSGCSITAELEQHTSFITNSSTPVRFAESLKNVERSFVSDRASLTAQMADAQS